MRNLPWRQATEMARRELDIKKFHHYNDVWLPKDLSQGDIIRADLPTDFFQKGEPKIRPRNCLLLGIDMNKETMEIDALRVLRFSYFTLDQDEKTDLHIYPRDLAFRTKISGFRDQVVLRTARIDVIPVESSYLGFYLDRIGRMDWSLFGLVNERLQRVHSAGKGYFKFHDDTVPMYSVTVPSLDPQKGDKDYGFSMPLRLATPLRDMEQGGRAEFLSAMRSARLTMDIGRVMQLQTERKARAEMSAKENEERLALRRIMTALSKPMSFRLTKSFERAIDNAAARLVNLEHTYEDKIKQEPFYQPGNKLSDIPDYRTLLRRHFGLEAEAKIAKPSIIIKQDIDPDSLSDLQNLGVGGLLREPKINIPEHLWRGRFVMMRIADLMNPENMGDAYRPCAIWKAYAKADETGDPVLAGFELHPCTRAASGAFNFKMKVRPLETTVRRPSFLIADMVVRAPIDAMYFQPNQREDFYFELLPNQVRDFEFKRNMAEQDERGVKIFGLNDVPEDWTELALPDAPNEKLRAKLIHWGKAKFPVSAPDVRPMAGSRNTARNFHFSK